jgi:hypothetical protein
VRDCFRKIKGGATSADGDANTDQKKMETIITLEFEKKTKGD